MTKTRPPLDPARKVSEGGHPEHRLALGIDCPEPRCKAAKGEWCPMPGTSWNLCGKRINMARGYDGTRRMKEGNRIMTHPPIKNGTRVKVAVRRAGRGDYTNEAIAARALHDGKIGIVREYHDSHGLCYGVAFELEIA